MKTQILLTVIFVLISLFFIGCSDDLSRGKAKDIILKELDEEYSRLSGFYLTYDGARNRIEPDLNYLYISGHPNNEKEMLNSLIAKGYLERNTVKTIYNTYFEGLVLTSKIQPYIWHRQYGTKYYIKVADMEDIIITGIKGNETNKTVDYDIIYSLNDLGKELPYTGELTIRQKRMKFTKYDDGWRKN